MQVNCIDLTKKDQPRQFLPEEWIGKGKVFPSQAPSYIQDALDMVLAIPLDYKNLIPNTELLVDDLLSTFLPTQNSSIIQLHPSVWFSKEEANETLSCLKRRPIPPKKLLEALQQEVGQQWFNGSSSIIDRRYKSSRLPLWVLTYWECMSVAVHARNRWEKAKEWIQQQMLLSGTNLLLEHSQIMDTTDQIIERLPWASNQSKHKRIHTTDLADLLSNDCLKGGIIDCGVANLSARLLSDASLKAKYMLGTLAFSREIQLATDKDYFKSHSPYLLQVYEHCLCEMDRPILIGPVFIQLSKDPKDVGHWVAYRIDFAKFEISFGDSLERIPPELQKFGTKVQWWLQTFFMRAFKKKGNIMPHGLQADPYSCGICTLNSLEHILFKQRLWLDSQKAYKRAKWFNYISESHLAPDVLGRVHDDHNVAIYKELLAADSLSRELPSLDTTDTSASTEPSNIASSSKMSLTFLSNTDTKSLSGSSTSTASQVSATIKSGFRKIVKKTVKVCRGSNTVTGEDELAPIFGKRKRNEISSKCTDSGDGVSVMTLDSSGNKALSTSFLDDTSSNIYTHGSCSINSFTVSSEGDEHLELTSRSYHSIDLGPGHVSSPSLLNSEASSVKNLSIKSSVSLNQAGKKLASIFKQSKSAESRSPSVTEPPEGIGLDEAEFFGSGTFRRYIIKVVKKKKRKRILGKGKGSQIEADEVATMEIGRTSYAAQVINEQVRNGTFVLNEEKMEVLRLQYTNTQIVQGLSSKGESR